MDGYILVSDGTTCTWQPHPTIPNPEPTIHTSAKCPCCGSRQFVTHQSRRVCAYCRSEQDGEPVQVVRAAQAPLAGGWGDLYGGAVLRPEMAVRIAKL